MNDIFISYTREDQSVARTLASALEKEGWSVWWDPKLRAGEHFDEVIEKALTAARCVIVLWSDRSVKSQYVRDEATYALEHEKLVPIAIEAVELPFRFKGIQTISLFDWNELEDSPTFRKLVEDISTILSRPAGLTSEHTLESEESLREQEVPQPEEIEARHAQDERRAESTETGNRMRLEDEQREQEAQEKLRAPRVLPPENSSWSKLRPIYFAAAAIVIVFVVMSVLYKQKPDETVGKVFRDRLKSGQEGPEMVRVPAGTFQMGNFQSGSDKTEQPAHTVRILKSFAIARYEVTFEEYDQFARSTGRNFPDDHGWGRGRQPVINVSWPDAVEYTNWLSAQTGKRYRLPTEAEWEYVASAGTETVYWWGNEMKPGMANCVACGSQWDAKQTAPVGSFSPNPLGLYDTAGNVWEWVQDCWHENYNSAPADGSAWEKESGGNCGQRVIRGGSWDDLREILRSSLRTRFNPLERINNVGFRPARDIQ